MPIEVLRFPEWKSDRRVDHEIMNPTWEQVEAALRALNNDDRNDMYLCPTAENEEEFLGVGGGAGRYLVTGVFG